MIGIDTNILVALVAGEHEFHARARNILMPMLAQGERFALTPDVICEFLHAVTDPRRVEKPLLMVDAIADAKAWWTADHCVQLFSSPDSVTLCFDWMAKFQLGRKRILDTQLAAILHTAGVRRLFASNPRDFKVFGVFDLLVP